MARWLFIYFSIDGYLSYSFWVTVENTVGYYILVDFFFRSEKKLNHFYCGRYRTNCFP